tara:strand:- start:3029 stop:3208 length:180 start_codon:yes stop_codon:yes gene_type:complete
MIFKVIGSNDYNKATHEEIPQEELWEDGELNNAEVQRKILHHTMQQGDWMLVRSIDGKD